MRHSRQSAVEAVVERQHVVLLGLARPHPDQFREPLRLASRRDRRSRRNPGRDERAPTCRSRTACPADDRPPPSSRPCQCRDGRTSRNIAPRSLTAPRRRRSTAQSSRPRSAFARTPAISAGGVDADQFEQGRHEIAGMDELMAQLAPAPRSASANASRTDRGCRRHGCSACSGAAACSTPSPSHAENWSACRARRCRRSARSFSAIGSGRRL